MADFLFSQEIVKSDYTSEDNTYKRHVQIIELSQKQIYTITRQSFKVMGYPASVILYYKIRTIAVRPP